MSWFSGVAEKLKATAQEKLNSETIAGFTEKVKNAVPKIDNEMLQKLTLTTPEMNAERERLYEAECRLIRVRDSLAGMMPWETRDPERDILVEECKEAILKLSSQKDSFFGPYNMPKINVKLEDKKGKEGGEEEALVEEDEETKPESEEPSKESLEQLKTLSPLPPLLEEFDLDAHIGLIQNLLKADPKLVEMQSSLSGGGERERTFWRNYFFHCAWCRYEAGLSIDEIWSEQQPAPLPQTDAATANVVDAADEHHEQEITFEKHDEETTKASEKAAENLADSSSKLMKDADKKDVSTHGSASASVSSNKAEGEYEMVGGADGNDESGLGDEPPVDYELDELEAEIARELEEM